MQFVVYLIASSAKKQPAKLKYIDTVREVLNLIERTRETGLEPATSGVTSRCSNQLNYSRKFINMGATGLEPMTTCV